MKRLNTNQWIAVAVGVTFVAYLTYGNYFVSLFSPQENNTQANMNLPQTGVDVEDLVVGDGEPAQRGDTITVHYVGTLVDGRVFDSSVDRNAPFELVLGQGDVIRGWDEGLVGMREGGKRRLIIAPDYAYGAQAIGPIPPNSTLVFEVQLLDVEKPAQGQ